MRTLRQILPRPTILLSLVLIYGLIRILEGLTGSFAYRRTGADKETAIRFFIVCCAMLLYVGCRVFKFHPGYRSDYKEWLRCKPWCAPQTPPFGPVLLVKWDLLVIVILSILLADAANLDGGAFGWFQISLWILFSLTGMLFLFSAFHGLGLLTLTPQGAYTCTIAILLTTVFLVDTMRLRFVLVGAAYLVTCAGLRQSLRLLKPDVDKPEETRRNIREVATDKTTSKLPFDGDKGRQPAMDQSEATRPRITVWNAFLWSVVVAFYLWVLVEEQDFPSSWVWILGAIGGGIFAAGRWLAYAGAPTTSLLGRIRYRKLIIPRYDSVNIAPLTALAAGGLSALGLCWVGVSDQVAVSCALGLCLFISLAMGPNLAKWKLIAPINIAGR